MRIRNIKNKKDILKNCPIVIDDPFKYKGCFKKLFNNNNPINLEIGTGKCKFIIESANKYPNINFIGIEKSDTVLALGVRDLEKYPKNLYLINYDANKINDILDKEIDLIYLNFSDPWPKERHTKRRLTSSTLLKNYDNIFKSDKEIILKTDNRELFEYSIVSLSNYGYIIKDISLDLHNLKNNDNITTEYEEKFSSLGYKIYKLVACKK